MLTPRPPHDAMLCAQIYVYRGAIQHHGIVTHVPLAGQGDGVSAAQSPSAGVQVVHFDSACDGVESTSLETFLRVREARSATTESPYGGGGAFLVPVLLLLLLFAKVVKCRSNVTQRCAPFMVSRWFTESWTSTAGSSP